MGRHGRYKSTWHVNVATVRKRLGNLAMARKQHQEATEHLLAANRIRTRLNLGGADLDVAETLKTLGINSRASGEPEAAARYFKQAVTMLDSIRCGI